MIIINTILPVFILLLAGYFTAKCNFFPDGANKIMTRYVHYFAIPVLLFDKLSNAQLSNVGDIKVIVSYFIPLFITMFIAIYASHKIFRISWDRSIIFGMGSIFSNTVLLGIPIILLAWGDSAAVPLFLVISFHAPLIFTVIIVIMGFARPNEQSLWRTIGNDIFKNPILWGIALGLLWNVLDWDLPPFIQTTVSMQSDAAAPVALFALGLALSQFKLGGRITESLSMTAIKTLVLPLFIFLIGKFLFGLTGMNLQVLVMLAAMPIGINPYLFSEHYKVMQPQAASAVLISNFFAMLTLPILLWVLNNFI